MKITFKHLSKTDFSLLLKWIEKYHIKQSLNPNAQLTNQLIEGKYDSYVKENAIINVEKKEIYVFIIYVHDIAIGYIQVHNTHDFPKEFSLEEIPSSLASFDFLIGKKEYLYKNIGPKILELFLKIFILNNIIGLKIVT